MRAGSGACAPPPPPPPPPPPRPEKSMAPGRRARRWPRRRARALHTWHVLLCFVPIAAAFRARRHGAPKRDESFVISTHTHARTRAR
jgi:hypothetical protein